MPWTSDKQRRWGNSPDGIEAMGQAKVDEFNRASKGMKLPEHKKKSKARQFREHMRKK
jgi:hypothetical protein